MSQAVVEQGAQALDAKFAPTAMWSVVKREFPDWYSEQLKEAATLTAQKQPPVAIYKHLAEALVALRRQHAQEALSQLRLGDEQGPESLRWNHQHLDVAQRPSIGEGTRPR